MILFSNKYLKTVLRYDEPRYETWLVCVCVHARMWDLAEGGKITMFALDQELGRDVPGRFHLTRLFILLMQLLYFLLSGHHLAKIQ